MRPEKQHSTRTRQNGKGFIMLCSICQSEAVRFGKDRKGNQRYLCRACKKTFVPAVARPLGTMRLPMEKAILCLRMLLEGNSIRSTERLTGVNRDTIMALLVTAGERCQRFMERVLYRLQGENVQAYEVWGYVGMKEKTRRRQNGPETLGDAYCFTALERTSKL